MPKGNPGSLHYRWSSGVGEHREGYVKVRVGKLHPLSDRNGWTYLHRLIWWAAGRTVPSGYVLHHKNEDKRDNRLENLEAITRAEHNRLHNQDKETDPKTGRFVGKKASGAMLDGVAWRQMPDVLK